jgi:transglutaminase-like putative cysteine protease
MEKVYTIRYHSQNHYEEPVTEAFFQFLVKPHSGDGQVVTAEKIKISAGDFFSVKNSFGFNTIRVHSVKPFTEFKIDCEFQVSRSLIQPEFSAALPVASERRALYSKGYIIDNYLFLKPTPLSVITRKELIPIIRDNQSLIGFLTELNTYVGTIVAYEQNQTNVETSAGEVLELKKGVCQDLTHVFIGMARANGIAARYVSGYINQGTGYIGSAMMHAWAEALVPAIGWVGFDPANNTVSAMDHIKVAHGLDYKDCSPVKGVLHTKGKNNTRHQVMVAEQQ